MKEKWKEISRIFNSALEKEPPVRTAYLAEVCGSDEELRAEIEMLLQAHEVSDSFIDVSKPSVARNEFLPLEKGAKIGAFEIISLLGKGGMGEVYLAQDLRLNRLIALKVLPPDSALDSQAKKRLLREAKSAAALEHPNVCAIHEIGESDERAFIVMQYIEGKTLAETLRNTRLTLSDVLVFGLQIAEALDHAHSHGVVHRDIKPANIIVSANQQIKVLDFGLAKKISLNDENDQPEVSAQSLLSRPGLILGTASYMSPEQARGESIDYRTDLWSFGVVLYEMCFGKTPFAGKTAVDKLVSILHDEPHFPDDFNLELQKILVKCLQKDCQLRYQTAAALIEDLRQVKQELDFEELLRTHTSTDSRSPMLNSKITHSSDSSLNKSLIVVQNPPKSLWQKIGWRQLTIIFLLLGVIGFGGWHWWENSNVNWAGNNVRRVEELAKAENYFEAFDLAEKIEKYLPDDENLKKLLPTISDNLTVHSEPSGAKVYLKRFQPDANGKFPSRVLVGTTPLNELRIARGQYVLEVEKEGFVAFRRTISGTIPSIGGNFIGSPPIKIEAKMLETNKVPEKTVFVPGGKYSLVNWSRPMQNEVELNDFFIDRYEVSNKDFKEFITTGGYLKTEFWKFPFVKAGKIIPLEEAAKEFKDKTGLPAPRSWINQNFPEGKGDFPVTDITWYEAAAYAAFRGKELPTIYQWERAARDGVYDPRYNSMPWGLIKQGETTNYHANFSGTGTTAVSDLEFGMSPFGAYNMAGNVAEWCLNSTEEGFITAGGAWNNLAYSFGDYGGYPGFYTSNQIGFRCVLNSPEATGDQGGKMLPSAEVPVYKVSNEAEYKTWLTHYSYDKFPIEAQTVETKETEAWTREKILINDENGEQIIAYLYLPKNYTRPLQVVHYLPAGDVVAGLRSLPDSVEMFLTPLIKSGRAVFTVVLKGYNERPYPPNYTPPERTTVEFRKQAVDWMTDLRRGLDYLETRKEVDRKKIEFLGISNGANLGLLLIGIESRYNSATLISAGLDKNWQNWIPEANFINFASKSRLPKLMVNGTYDETHPFKTFAEPLYKLLAEPKKIVTYNGGHIPTTEFLSITVNGWLDEKLGVPAK